MQGIVDSVAQFHLSWLNWSLAFLASFILGMGKAGVKGLGVLIVTLMAILFGGKASTGILIPLMVVADILAVYYYNRHTQWKFLLKILPTHLYVLSDLDGHMTSHSHLSVFQQPTNLNAISRERQ